MKKRLFASALFSTAIALASAAGFAQDDPNNPSKVVQIERFRLVGTNDPNIWHVKGIAINQSAEKLPQASIRFKAYDSTGAVVGEALAIQGDLGPGETWSFDAPVVGNVDHVVLDDVSPHGLMPH